MSSYRGCLQCNWLGDRIMGTDVDELLAYQTPKVVTIRDRTLGMLKYTFMFIIICYVFIFQILFKGSHFQLQPHSGIARMQLQHPTKKQCSPMALDCSANYTSLKKLPYCNQYTGKLGNPTTKKECKYFDALDLLTPMDGGYLMPSFIETYDQLPGCKPNAKNNYNCDKKYEFVDGNGDRQTGSGRAQPKAQFFVADLESFTLLIDHSFRVETGTVEYDDFKMQGYWLDCSNEQWTLNSTWLSTGSHCVKKPIICAHRDCEKMGMVTASGQTAGKPRREHGKGSRAGLVQSRSAVGALSLESGSLGGATSENMKPDPEMYSLSGGDVFSIRTLYEMAGRSLDDWWYDASDKRNMTIRQRGTVLVVNIHYNNLQPWTLFRPQDPPEYVMSVTSRPVEKYKHIRADASGGRTRELTMEYGTLVMVQSSSSIGVFKMIHMLIVVSTSFGLLAASSVITDLLAVYVLPLRNEYSKAKYEETKDFHDFYVEHEEAREAESERI